MTFILNLLKKKCGVSFETPLSVEKTLIFCPMTVRVISSYSLGAHALCLDEISSLHKQHTSFRLKNSPHPSIDIPSFPCRWKEKPVSAIRGLPGDSLDLSSSLIDCIITYKFSFGNRENYFFSNFFEKK